MRLYCHSCVSAWREDCLEAWSGHCPRCCSVLSDEPLTRKQLKASQRRRANANKRFPYFEVLSEGDAVRVEGQRKSRPKISAAKRDRIYARDGYQCQRCGESKRKKLSLDHIVKWADGGSNKDENLRTLCKICNSSRDTWERTAEGQFVRVNVPLPAAEFFAYEASLSAASPARAAVIDACREALPPAKRRRPRARLTDPSGRNGSAV